jgi:hypothetical protein
MSDQISFVKVKSLILHFTAPKFMLHAFLTSGGGSRAIGRFDRIGTKERTVDYERC